MKSNQRTRMKKLLVLFKWVRIFSQSFKETSESSRFWWRRISRLWSCRSWYQCSSVGGCQCFDWAYCLHRQVEIFITICENTWPVISRMTTNISRTYSLRSFSFCLFAQVRRVEQISELRWMCLAVHRLRFHRTRARVWRKSWIESRLKQTWALNKATFMTIFTMP